MAWKNKEREREWRREYERKRYAADPTIREKQRANRQANLGRYAQYQRNYRQRSARENMVIAMRYRAKKFSLPCDVTIDSLEWPTHCPILGIELDYSTTIPGNRKMRRNFPTLDRKTNDLGYVKGNVFVISHRANRIKSDATIEELEAVLAYMKGRRS